MIEVCDRTQQRRMTSSESTWRLNLTSITEEYKQLGK